ncbi:MAG: TonB-dependent receptor [Planctomycetes bacterium]|nr:TonB-dependent receptor [Planctomycetota bacterium]MBL7042805.1 TonB-dependent receptor [Pirellulaceae bacterium]
MTYLWMLVVTGLMAFDAHSAPAQDIADGPVLSDATDDILSLADAPLESLAGQAVVVPAMDVEVSTVSRTASTVGQSPAAVYVVTGEMIRRSGARSIPEVLRLVPGMNVARVNGNRWAVSARGFNEVFANKLLVQIDGRTVYSPVFSGVYWDQQDVLLEDVDRIEVIRGPGATVWGANAVNGVINIITKRARDTQGMFAEGGGGSREHGFGAFRYGGQIGDSLHYRIYGVLFERDGGFSPTDAGDDWRKRQMGFLVDWEPCDDQRLTVQGDFYRGQTERRYDSVMPAPPFFRSGVDEIEEPAGSNVLMRWSREIDEESDWAVQLYYDSIDRPEQISGFSDSYTTFDLDFQHRFAAGRDHSLTWGFGYRHTRSVTEGVYVVSFDPPSRSFGLISAFVQDQITLSPDRLNLVVGSKFEDNDFSGFEFQPTARLLWTPSDRQTVWASVSRAVRTPSRSDQDIRLVAYPAAVSFAPPGATFVQALGSRGVDSEQLLAFEIGARAQPNDDFWWDLAVFSNHYDDLVMRYPVTPFLPAPSLPPALWPFVATNAGRAHSYGFELAATYRPTPCWDLRGGYSFLKMHLDAPPGQSPGGNQEGTSPQNQAFLQSSWNWGRGLELDLIGRYVDTLLALAVPSYVVLDARLAWSPTETLEMAVVGRHLLDASHAEFATRTFHSSEVQQEVYGIVTLRY